MTKIIADACSNHNGSRELMEQMIAESTKAGVDIIKFQSFKSDKLNPNWPDYENSKAYYKSVELSGSDHIFIIQKCRKYKIEPLFTAFHMDAVDNLAYLGLKSVKIASPDANNWRLIARSCMKFERVLISTGLHSTKQIGELLQKVKPFENQVTLLHCRSLYPTPLEKVGLLHLGALMKAWPSVGYSDHTLGLDAAKIAIALGAACVERHFTLDRNLPGRDHAISSTPDEFAELVQWRDTVQKVMYCKEQEVDAENRRYIGRWI